MFLTVRQELDLLHYLDQLQVQRSVHLLFKVQGEGRQLQPRVMLLLSKFSVLTSGEISVPNESYHLYYIQLLFKSLYIYVCVCVCVCVYLTPQFHCNVNDSRPT